MNVINERQKACIADSIANGFLIRETASADFKGNSCHDSRTVVSLVDRGALRTINVNKNGYPLRVEVNLTNELIQSFPLIGSRVYYLNKENQLVGGLIASGLGFKNQQLFFAISFGHVNSYYPVSSIRLRSDLDEINFCQKCKHGIMWARPYYFNETDRTGLYFKIKCSYCGTGNGIDWMPSLIEKTSLINKSSE